VNVIFRTDASEGIGTGHLIRCLVLADALARQGGTCHFLLRQQNAVWRRILDGRPYPVGVLDLPQDIDPLEDAHRSLRCAQGWPAADWLVVDHYGLDARWERAARALCPNLLALDDLADRPHDCDVLVDPGLGRHASDYSALVPPSTNLLLGPSFAILKPAFALHHGRAPLWPAVRRAHVFFGGGSAAAWLPDCVGLLMDLDRALEVFAVGFCDEQAMSMLQERHGKRLTWARQVDDMAAGYACCSLALGSPGTATWERACIGLPSAILATAPNQVPILEQLDRLGLCRFLGSARDWDTPALTSAIRDFLHDDSARAAMRALGVSTVDGRGVERLLQHLHDGRAIHA